METYLTEFGQLNSLNEYLYNLQLEFLSTYISSDIPTIKANIDQLVSNKSLLIHDEVNWEGNKINLMNEVDNIILSFDLKPYHDLTKPPIKATRTQAESTQSTNQSIRDDNARRLKVRSSQNDKTHLRTMSLQFHGPLKVELPKLSKTQRRMSLDLMHSKPYASSSLNGLTRASSLSKPALASTSNVNVLTKPNFTSKEPAGEAGVTGDPTKANKFNIALILPNKNIIQPIKSTDDNLFKDLNAKPRRSSLVGDKLPNYIKAQLNLAGDGKKLSNKQSRLHNLLSNSESLYVNNKDISSSRSDVHTGTSDYYNSYENNSSDDDKEYILPNLITKYYEMNGQVDDDDIDFVQINGSFVHQDDFRSNGGLVEYEDELGQEQGNDEEHHNDDNDNDDEYLFKI